MKKYLLLVTLLISASLSAQIGVDTTSPNASSALDVVSTNKGVLLPRMTQAERNGIPVGAAQTGLLIYQTDVSPGFYYYNGTVWTTFGNGSGWSLTGDAGTTPGANNLGTTDAQDFVIATNNTEVMRITSGGNMGVGTTTPSTLFHFVGGGGTILLNEDFESLPVATVSSNTTDPVHTIDANGCPNDMDWEITATPYVTCPTLCANNRATIDYQGTACDQDATLVLDIGAINSDSITIAFDYVYWVWDGPESFQVNLYNETTSSIETIVLGPLTDAGGNISETSFSQTFSGIATGDIYSLHFVYIASDDNGASIDNVVVSIPPDTMRIDDGNQVDGYALTSDVNGVATWNLVSLTGGDQDWAFDSGSTNTDPIYHQGNVKIGVATGSTHNLHVYNGTTSGSVLGIGSIEYIQDGIAAFEFDYTLLPFSDGVQNLGSITNRWVTVWADFVSRQADIKKMRDIQPIHYGLEEIMKLNPITYQWKEEKINDFVIPEKDKSTKVGFSAQELQKVLPEVVQTYQWKEYEENPGVLVKKQANQLAVNYTEIIPVAIKAIQEQQVRIEAIRKENENLRQLIDNLIK